MHVVELEILVQLVEERVKALTTAVEWQKRVVTEHEERYERASPSRKKLRSMLLENARITLAHDTGRQLEAEQQWKLFNAHIINKETFEDVHGIHT